MTSLTACVITKNEETNLRECLESVRFCDEIIVVDSLSTDQTVEIAREFTDQVIQRAWPGHIEQKNFAIDQATNSWVLCIDADERVSEPLRAEIQRIFALQDISFSGFRVNRLNQYLGRWIRHGGWYPDRKIRLFRRDRGRWGGTNPHDRVEIRGEIHNLNLDLLHYSYADLGAHLRTINNFTGILAREKLKRHPRFITVRLLFSGPLKFVTIYVLRRGFLDGWPGLICATMGGYYTFLKYAKLWELVYARNPDEERKKSSYV